MDAGRSIKWIVTITDRGVGEKVAKIYNENKVAIQLLIRGRGTAGSEIMDYLGLDEPEKDILLSLVPGSVATTLMQSLNSKLHFKKPGNGVIFTIPLSGISLAMSNKVNCIESEMNVTINKEEQKMDAHASHDLVVAVTDEDTCDVVVEAAKAAGCTGGTVIKGRKLYSEEVCKVFGITIQPEKEIIMILAKREEKQRILKAICEKIMEETGQHGLAFSLPVDEVLGIRAQEDL